MLGIRYTADMGHVPRALWDVDGGRCACTDVVHELEGTPPVS